MRCRKTVEIWAMDPSCSAPRFELQTNARKQQNGCSRAASRSSLCIKASTFPCSGALRKLPSYQGVDHWGPLFVALCHCFPSFFGALEAWSNLTYERLRRANGKKIVMLYSQRQARWPAGVAGSAGTATSRRRRAHWVVTWGRPDARVPPAVPGHGPAQIRVAVPSRPHAVQGQGPKSDCA